MGKMHEFKRKLGIGTSAALLAGALTAANVLPVMAADGLDMSTIYPGISVKAGETVDFPLSFESLSGNSYDADLSVESIPDGWTGYFKSDTSQISKIHIPSESTSSENSESTVSFSLTLPEEAEEGTYEVQLKADAGGQNTDTLELEVTVDENEATQGSFSSEYPEQQGAAGTSFSFDTTIVNNAGTEQSYSLSAEAPSGWQVTFTPSGESSQVASMSVEAGSSKGLTVAVTPPETIKEGEYTIPCTAISANEKLSTELKVKITGSYELEVSTPSGNLSLDAYADSEKDFTLSIKNTGNVDLNNINLTSSAPTDWDVEFDQPTIDTLEAGASVEVTAHITPDKNAITGDYVATITASNEEASAEAQFRISVKTHTSWGIFAVVVIVILLACLGYIFKKYGRR